jgi:hypothetical protein
LNRWFCEFAPATPATLKIAYTAKNAEVGWIVIVAYFKRNNMIYVFTRSATNLTGKMIPFPDLVFQFSGWQREV